MPLSLHCSTMKFASPRFGLGAYELVADQEASARNTREQSAGSLIVYGRAELEPRTPLVEWASGMKTLANHKK